jgi:hypothetical protein
MASSTAATWRSSSAAGVRARERWGGSNHQQSKETSAMKNISTGFGLCVLGLGLASWPIIDRLAPQASASSPAALTSAVAATALAQAGSEPTVVWYGLSSNVTNRSSSQMFVVSVLKRAWSDGRVEMKLVRKDTLSSYNYVDQTCSDAGVCTSPWILISDPSDGYAYRSDINADQLVNGADLATMLADWGDAPRYDLPPSDCPLNLINP